MVSRLRKNHEKMTKTATFTMVFDSFTLKSGDMITFEGRIVNNKPWYQVLHDSDFNTSSYYDGADFERAFDIYTECVLAFQGAAKAEELRKRKDSFEKRIQQMIDASESDRKETMYNYLKRSPKFLGMSDF
jgi:hypothetical protein